MSRRKPKTRRFNKRYGTRVRTDLQQKRNNEVLRAGRAKPAAKPKESKASAK